MNKNKLVKKAISFVMRNDDEEVLVVLRPEDDEDLSGVWGLPAGSLKEGESWEDAVRRAGIEKIGVEIEPTELIGEGYLERDDYVLHMREYEVKGSGDPVAKQEHEDITQYQAVKFVPDDEVVEYLKITAPQGSLCCMLFIYNQEVIDEDWMAKHDAEVV